MTTPIVAIICSVLFILVLLKVSNVVSNLSNPPVPNLDAALQELFANFNLKSALLLGTIDYKTILQIQKMDTPQKAIHVSIFIKGPVVQKVVEIKGYLSSQNISTKHSIEKLLHKVPVDSIEFVSENNQCIQNHIKSILFIIQIPESALKFCFLGSKPIRFKEFMTTFLSPSSTNKHPTESAPK